MFLTISFNHFLPTYYLEVFLKDYLLEFDKFVPLMQDLKNKAKYGNNFFVIEVMILT